MGHPLRDAVVAVITSSKPKKVKTKTILDAVYMQPSGMFSDFEVQGRLLAILYELEIKNLIRLPVTKKCWNRHTGLPEFVTAVRAEEDDAKRKQKQKLDALRNKTAWEPTRMAAFAHKLKTIKELEKALRVNQYLLTRDPDSRLIPHRERALMIFGNEKALDNDIRHGLFKGRVSLTDLDCFYCPEPLPFRSFSLDKNETGGKPLLMVENANTYWSCCRANEILKCYAAVVYGQGFAAERSSEGLAEIETQVESEGIAYFGDLDPAGIAIPMRINRHRQKKGLSLLYAERRLYRALLQKNLSTPYGKSQEKDHSPDLAREWLGENLAEIYLKKCHKVRWPQEGVTVQDIMEAVSVSSG